MCQSTKKIGVTSQGKCIPFKPATTNEAVMYMMM